MEHKIQKVEIKGRKAGEVPSHIHLFIEGTEIRGIRSLEIKVEPNEIPRLILDLNLWDISIDSEFLMYQKGVGSVNFVKVNEILADDMPASDS
nr:MAG TPA: hypothetical protein [Caudoviricetes sp.]